MSCLGSSAWGQRPGAACPVHILPRHPRQHCIPHSICKQLWWGRRALQVSRARVSGALSPYIPELTWYQHVLVSGLVGELRILACGVPKNCVPKWLRRMLRESIAWGLQGRRGGITGSNLTYSMLGCAACET